MPSELWAVFDNTGKLLAVFSTKAAAIEFRMAQRHPGYERRVPLDPPDAP